MAISLEDSQKIYQGIKEADIRFMSALAETWLVHLLSLAEVVNPSLGIRKAVW